MDYIKPILLSALGGLIAGAVMLVFMPTPVQKVIQQISGTTTQGGTGQTARQYNVYGVNLAAPGSNATTSSIVNNTGNDLFITGLKVGCENVGTSNTAYSGAGLASLTVYAATTSTSNPANVTNTNKVGGGNITIATSSSSFIQASTTALSGNSAWYSIWPNGTYLTFTTNATNTAVCTFGADVTSS